MHAIIVHRAHQKHGEKKEKDLAHSQLDEEGLCSPLPPRELLLIVTVLHDLR